MVECPRCGLEMVSVLDRGYEYMRCGCGEELETDIQRKRNDDVFRDEEKSYG